MIPKVIHYCWFGRNPLPKLAVKCIESWKKYLPEYEIKEWNEDNFDVNMIPYTSEAYKAKKYAFVSDYARFWILYKFGGLYFDTDVEIIKPMDEIVAKGPFMGCEKEVDRNAKNKTAKDVGVAPGLGLGVSPGLDLYKEILDAYTGYHFLKSDGTLNKKTVVDYTTEILEKHGLKYTSQIQKCAGVWIYPREYFCPLDYYTGKFTITENSYSIHHYTASWQSKEDKFKIRLSILLGKRCTKFILRIKKFFK